MSSQIPADVVDEEGLGFLGARPLPRKYFRDHGGNEPGKDAVSLAEFPAHRLLKLKSNSAGADAIGGVRVMPVPSGALGLLMASGLLLASPRQLHIRGIGWTFRFVGGGQATAVRRLWIEGAAVQPIPPSPGERTPLGRFKVGELESAQPALEHGEPIARRDGAALGLSNGHDNLRVQPI
jgi:hypothetical protein